MAPTGPCHVESGTNDDRECGRSAVPAPYAPAAFDGQPGRRKIAFVQHQGWAAKSYGYLITLAQHNREWQAESVHEITLKRVYNFIHIVG